MMTDEERRAKRRAYNRAWYQAHKDEPEFKAKAIARTKAWQDAHREAFLAKVRQCMRRRREDPAMREAEAAYVKSYHRAHMYNYLDTRFFKWEQVEGYDGWNEHYVVHHRLEDKGYTRDELKAIGAYYNCCPEDLICMSASEHTKHHNNLRKNK